MGTNTMDTPNTTTPAVDPRDNIGMQWLVIGMVPGPLQFYCGTQTRREALDYIREERPQPDANEYYAVIKARDFFVEPGSGGAIDDEEADDMAPGDWNYGADTGNPLFAWLLEEFRPSEVEALIAAILQSGDPTDAERVGFLNAALDGITGK